MRAGQFAIRGGIIDVFSFAHDLPYRIELFGDEVESIRSFDPGSQLSVEQLDNVSLMPNIQTRLIQEERQSFLDFIPSAARNLGQDFQLTCDVLQKCTRKPLRILIRFYGPAEVLPWQSNLNNYLNLLKVFLKNLPAFYA